VTQLLERLLAAAEAGGRDASTIEVLVQLALVRHAVGDTRRATDLVRRALVLAEREGHIRVFLEAGTGVSAVLRDVEPGSPGGRHARAVLAAAAGEPPRPSPPAGTSAAPPAPLVDALSARELGVLRLLESDLGGPDIARELSVSVNTVRTHTRHIYAKLGVTNRREAVREALRLGLLHPGR
jgi:LuxR family maltose regulon positive regulatory protein